MLFPSHARGAADGAVERLQLRAHLLEIEKSIDASKQMVVGDVVIEAEIIEQLRWCDLRPHHRPAPAKQHENGIMPAKTDQPQIKSTQSAHNGHSVAFDEGL